jgi:hypothetical protein
MKRMITLGAVAVLTLGTLGAVAWHAAGRTFAQGGVLHGVMPALHAQGGRVMIKIGGPGDGTALPGPDVLGLPIHHDLFGLAAKTLGVSRESLAAEQKAGKSLDDIAKAHGTTRRAILDGIQAGMQDDLKSALAKAVMAGKLTQAQADKMSANLNIELDLSDLPPADEADDSGTTITATRALKLTGPLDEAHAFFFGGQAAALPALEPATLDTVKSLVQQATKDGRLSEAQADTVTKLLEHVGQPMMDVIELNQAAPVPDGGDATTPKAGANPL